jgi:hypothetical protein
MASWASCRSVARRTERCVAAWHAVPCVVSQRGMPYRALCRSVARRTERCVTAWHAVPSVVSQCNMAAWCRKETSRLRNISIPWSRRTAVNKVNRGLGISQSCQSSSTVGSFIYLYLLQFYFHFCFFFIYLLVLYISFFLLYVGLHVYLSKFMYEKSENRGYVCENLDCAFTRYLIIIIDGDSFGVRCGSSNSIIIIVVSLLDLEWSRPNREVRNVHHTMAGSRSACRRCSSSYSEILWAWLLWTRDWTCVLRPQGYNGRSMQLTVPPASVGLCNPRLLRLTHTSSINYIAVHWFVSVSSFLVHLTTCDQLLCFWKT